MSIFWSKRTNFGKKRAKKGPKRFLSNVKSYEQIEKNWPKCKFFGRYGQILFKKGSKKGQKHFCQNFHWVIIVIDHTCSLNMQR